jgi:hypothetical protein
MAVRVNDFVFIFSGGFAFSQTFSVANDFDFGPYNAAREKLNHTRNPRSESRGADNDINANVDSVIASMRVSTNGQLNTVGQVVLLGRSNGCALALAVAAELNDQGITDLTFVGLSDVPMWDSGRNPPVRKVGDFRPINGPIPAGAAGPNPGIGGRLSVGPVPNNEIPFYKLPQEIKARKKVNLLQIQGNHIRWANSLKRWIWWSDFSGGEVHGKLDSGFDNRLFTVQNAGPLGGRLGNNFASDLDFHVKLNTGENWKKMTSEAATALADFPQAVL